MRTTPWANSIVSVPHANRHARVVKVLKTVALSLLLLPLPVLSVQIDWFKDTVVWTTEFNFPVANIQNYESPINYADGSVYVKFAVVEWGAEKVPGFTSQICMWQSPGYTQETCSRNMDYTEDHAPTYYALGRPRSWWSLNYDWSRPPDAFREIMLSVWRNGYTDILSTGGGCGDWCISGDEGARWLPVTFFAHVIFVSQGNQLTIPSDWDDCPWVTTPVAGTPRSRASVPAPSSAVFDARAGRIRLGAATLPPSQTVRIVGMDGAVIREVSADRSGRGCAWDGRDRSGSAVGSGVYLLVSSGTQRTVYGRLMVP
jgi:hypothetical protein